MYDLICFESNQNNQTRLARRESTFQEHMLDQIVMVKTKCWTYQIGVGSLFDVDDILGRNMYMRVGFECMVLVFAVHASVLYLIDTSYMWHSLPRMCKNTHLHISIHDIHLI